MLSINSAKYLVFERADFNLDDENLKSRLLGNFIVLDGPDGCGKSTQTKLLANWLSEQGSQVVIFRDPGATDIGEKIRQILLNPEHIKMNAATEVLLYMAARVQLWQERIAPALEQNKCVVLDRWLSSTCAYQGYAGSFGMKKVIEIAEDVLERPWPDLTIILDVDLETAANRLSSQPDRIEAKPPEYHQKVREGFLKLSGQQENFVVVDSAGDIEAVHKKILEVTAQANLKYSN